MAFLKQHRKATLQLEGRKLIGNFEVSLTNQGDRETIIEFINEMRKQVREFDSAKVTRKTPVSGTTKKKRVAKAKAKRVVQKKVPSRRKK